MENIEKMDQASLYYLEKAPVSKAIMHMVIPMMLSFIATIIYNITDAFFIGKLDNTAMMASVTLALAFSSILMALGHLFGVGAGTYVSRLLGEDNSDSAKKVCSINFWSSILTGIIFMALCLPLLSPLLHLLGAKGETLLYTRNYILVFVIGAPFVIANLSLEETVRAEGASTASMIGLISGVVINIILDPIFIFLLHLDIMGAALASVIGNIVSVVWFIYYLQRKSAVQSVSIKDFKPSKEIYKNIIKVGISAFLLDGFMVTTTLLFNNYSMLYGNSVVAGLGISQRVIQIIDFVGMGFSMGAVPLIAYSYSAKNQERLRQIIKTTVLYMIGITLGLSVILFGFRSQVIGIFSIDPEVIAIGQKILFAQLCSTIFAGLSELFTGIFQAFGTGVQSTLMSSLRGIVFIPILIFGNLLFAVNGIIWAITISEGFTCLVGLILFLGIWKKINPAHKAESPN
ncbi:putative efflux protein, MATE family [Desulfosporosinus orientis DSM 765]|uniref:Multidrug export protein MepA n=1 Tax=Desulfosporosinus orientis (strain ATCC 19365 / DSM 765 / NCIMB 8382 / VKM B-1628 / Singapore I) TaxID=768706 RepID=G7WIY0_DESOD|nr:MATE family efflux transporter [Desulfosporosinus orientis]AET69705.1 putative efflux protein, MATE family [Desulfosporosinus orientis DSM 765]